MTKQNTCPDDAFPESALIPKQETGVSSFIAKNPSYDGRGVVIAIFDTGVDPRASGLQITSDGKPKVIQILDGSGAGDVDMKTEVVAENGVVTGLSGRKLHLPDGWNPNGKYRIGLKAAYELYSTSVRERVKKDYQEKRWSAFLNPALAEAARNLQKFETSHTGELKPEEKVEKEELEARVDVLAKLDKNFADLGPVFDCIMYHDETSWKVVVDTTCEGKLENCEVLGPYSETLKCGVLSVEDNMSYCVNVHDDGEILEIVGISYSHGTHVASIAAANFPDNPARNGIAPGAQIISIMLGDARLSSMETGTSLYRAVAAVLKMNVDVVNMSFGESSKWCKGRIWDYIEEMINKKGILMMASAGNSGPALTTLGTPPTQNAFGVGAMVSPPMMEAEYSLREKIPAIGFNWTSRGPGIDGRLGPSICAPGAAITSVPQCTLQGSQLMNGTSMAAPNVAGAVSLLVSAMKQNSIKYSPYMVRRCLENTALKMSTHEPFANGQGLIQVEQAWEWLQANSNETENLLRFEIKIDGGRKRGIYLREPQETSKPLVGAIAIEPSFVDNKNVNPERKTAYDQNFTLMCEAPWVQAPSVLNMMFSERQFGIKVDPTSLEPGRVHYTEIAAFESGKTAKGPVFRIPITVIKPKTLPHQSNTIADTVTLKPGVPNRNFVVVPEGATWCLVKMKSCCPVNASSVCLHTLQIKADASFPENNFEKLATLQPLGEISYPIKVLPNRTLEICFSKWWTSFGDLSLSWSVQFFGLQPNSNSLHFTSGEGISRFDVSASLGPEEANPTISLKQHVMVLRPAKSKIVPGGTRDLIPDGRIVHANSLTYNFSVAKSGEAQIGLPLLFNYLYESEFNSQIWMLFNQNKQLLACGDAFPDKYSVKLEKGDYTVVAQVRHEDRNLLEKITSDLPLHVILKLSSSLNLDVYSLPDQALVQGKKASASVIPGGEERAFYVGHPPSDKLPKGIAAGHFLQGNLVLTSDEQGKKVATFPFRYYISELGSKKKGDKENKEKDKKTPDEEFEEAACDLCAQHLTKGSEKAEAMYQELIKSNPQANQLILAKIQALLKKETEEREENNRQVVELADQVLANVNPEKLLLSLGCRQDKNDQSSSKQLEKQKQLVIDVLTKKGEALCNLLALKQSVSSSDDKDIKEKLKELYTDMQRWVDPMQEPKTAPFMEKYLESQQLYGSLAKLLLKVQEDKPTVDTEKKLIETYRKLSWRHCVVASERSLLVKFPPEYRPV